MDPFKYSFSDPLHSNETGINRIYEKYQKNLNDINSVNPAKYNVIDNVLNILNRITKDIILHPFLIIRRQAQLNKITQYYHISPITCIPCIFRGVSRQGFSSLFNGLEATLVTEGLFVSIHSLLNYASSSSKLDIPNIFSNFLVMPLTIFLVTPFYCSSAIETVQSSITSENASPLTCIREGLNRLKYWRRSQDKRMLPITILSGPTIVYHISNHIITSFMSKLYTFLPLNAVDSAEYRQMISDILGFFTAEAILYPLNTITLRLYVQGTRTIIDSVDPNKIVIPVISDYDGPIDCYLSIIRDEGISGLYKGFGCLVLHYALRLLVLKCARNLLQNLS